MEFYLPALRNDMMMELVFFLIDDFEQRTGQPTAYYRCVSTYHKSPSITAEARRRRGSSDRVALGYMLMNESILQNTDAWGYV